MADGKIVKNRVPDSMGSGPWTSTEVPYISLDSA